MRVLHFYISWALAATATAYNLTALVEETPSCALKCITGLLPTYNCTLLNLAPCMCTNIPLQANLSKCVQQTCTVTEQGQAGEVSQGMCKGYPQQSRTRETLTIALTFFGITTIFLGLRIWSRFLVAQGLFADDYAAIAAYVFVIASVSLDIAFHNKGFGQHIWDVDPKEDLPVLKVWYAAQQIYTQTQTWSRVSLVLLYIRLFPKRKFQHFCKLCLAFLACHSISFTLVILFQCKPIEAAWNLAIPGKCVSTNAFAEAAAGVCIFEDIVFLLMPLSQLRSLQINRAQKMSLMSLFGIGIFATVTSIVRWTFLSRFSHSFDVTWDNVPVLEWSTIETDVMLICSCLPSVRPLYVRFMPKVFNLTQRTLTNPFGTYLNRIWPSTGQPTKNSWVELNEKKSGNSNSEPNSGARDVGVVPQPENFGYSKQPLDQSETLKEENNQLVTQVRKLEEEISNLKRNLEADSSDEEQEIGIRKKTIITQVSALASTGQLRLEAETLRARIQELQAEITELKTMADKGGRRRRTLA